MAVKSRLSRKLRKGRRNRDRLLSLRSRSRGLRLETLEDRRLLASDFYGGMGPVDSGPEGEASDLPEYVDNQL